MKKLTLTALAALVVFGLGLATLHAHQTMNNQGGMQNQQTQGMQDNAMSPQQAQKMQSAITQMKTTREKMLAAKTPAERQKLMQQHLRDMETCMNMMSTFNGMGRSGSGQVQPKGNRMMGGNNHGMMSSGQNRTMMGGGNQKMGTPGKQGMMMNSGMCGSMMQEMMKSVLAQMGMLMKR